MNELLQNLGEGKMSLRKISPYFWQTQKQIEMSIEAKLVYIYILTSPHSSGPGCYYLPPLYIANDTNLSIKQVESGINELNKSKIIYYCYATNWIFCPEYLANNPIRNIKMGIGFKDKIEAIPSDFSGYQEFYKEIQKNEDKLPKSLMEVLNNKYAENKSIYGEKHNRDEEIKTQEKYKNRFQEQIKAFANNADKITNLKELDESSDIEDDEEEEKMSNVPVKKIIDLYHSICPELSRVRASGKQLNKFIKTRWKEDKERQNLQWWEDFFQNYVRPSDFLMGRATEFQANLTWLCRPQNFEKVVNGNYVNAKNSAKEKYKYNNTRFRRNENAVNEALQELDFSKNDVDLSDNEFAPTQYAIN